MYNFKTSVVISKSVLGNVMLVLKRVPSTYSNIVYMQCSGHLGFKVWQVCAFRIIIAILWLGVYLFC